MEGERRGEGRRRNMDDVVSPEFVAQLVCKRRLTHREVSQELRRRHPDVRGLSEMSVRRYCNEHGIHKTSRLSDGQLDVVVEDAVSKVTLLSYFL